MPLIPLWWIFQQLWISSAVKRIWAYSNSSTMHRREKLRAYESCWPILKVFVPQLYSSICCLPLPFRTPTEMAQRSYPRISFLLQVTTSKLWWKLLFVNKPCFYNNLSPCLSTVKILTFNELQLLSALSICLDKPVVPLERNEMDQEKDKRRPRSQGGNGRTLSTGNFVQ